MRPAWIEINIESLKNNIRHIKEMVPESTEIMGVVKADGYGHGAVKVVEILRGEGIKRFAVALLQEGIELRKSGIGDSILVLGYTGIEDCKKLVEYDLTTTIFSYEQAEYLNSAAIGLGRRASIHIKIDTGMGRIGFSPDEASIPEILSIYGLPGIYVEGIYSHLANADQNDDLFSKKQFDVFSEFYRKLEDVGLKIPVRHIANSAALLRYPEMYLDMVRTGICMYGLYPNPGMAIGHRWDFLRPVMEVKSRLVQVKKVPPGTPISYGCTFRTEKDSIIGTVPLGYADGILRSLSNKGQVLVNGRRCLISGRICMDQFMVDLTDKPDACVGDEVVIMGSQGNERITGEEIASIADTISYEVVSRMAERLSRIYT